MLSNRSVPSGPCDSRTHLPRPRSSGQLVVRSFCFAIRLRIGNHRIQMKAVIYLISAKYFTALLREKTFLNCVMDH
jgi:hypothetical protein